MEQCDTNSKNSGFLRLRCSVQHYDWGIVGENSLAGRLSSLNSGSDRIDPHKPYAELWIGTHESGPSFVNEARECGEDVTLKSWISRNPNVLGNEVLNKWGSDLPFLFKVLSIGKALSIQAHPDKELATILHELQPNIYKDGNHKPEMVIALTDFEALYGFIGLKELRGVLCAVPEIVELIGKAEVEQVLHANEHVGQEKVKAVLESIFIQLMSSSKDTISELIFKIKQRLNREKEKRELTNKEQLVLRLEGQYPDDVGVIESLFLNYVKLQRGEALHLGANVPHAYISGECIECMATSDNVVRAGLTYKHRDIQTLLSMLSYQPGFPKILDGISMNPYTKRYLPPFDEFEVDCCILPRAASVVFPSGRGPSLFLFISGKGTIHAGFAGEDAIGEGSVLFVPANVEIRVAASSIELQLYRAGVNSRSFAALNDGCARTVGNLLYTVN